MLIDERPPVVTTTMRAVRLYGPGVPPALALEQIETPHSGDRDGLAAEVAAVPANLLAPKPRGLSHLESAAIPLAALTAWQGLFDRGALESGQRLLEPVDYVFDTVGGELFARSLALGWPDGRIVSDVGKVVLEVAND